MTHSPSNSQTASLESEVRNFYLRFAKAADNGTGVRISADEVQALAVTTFGEWADNVREGILE